MCINATDIRSQIRNNSINCPEARYVEEIAKRYYELASGFHDVEMGRKWKSMSELVTRWRDESRKHSGKHNVEIQPKPSAAVRKQPRASVSTSSLLYRFSSVDTNSLPAWWSFFLVMRNAQGCFFSSLGFGLSLLLGPYMSFMEWHIVISASSDFIRQTVQRDSIWIREVGEFQWPFEHGVNKRQGDHRQWVWFQNCISNDFPHDQSCKAQMVFCPFWSIIEAITIV